MKVYRTLLFDLDDTLLDFGAAERVALQTLFEEEEIFLTPEIESRYKTINKGLWRSFEEGKIERDEVLNTRFSRLFEELGRKMDGALLEKNYRIHLEKGHQFIEGAKDLLAQLSNSYELFIVTNGVSKTQHKRIHDSGIFPLCKGIFVSEDTGHQKPMKEYFDYVFERIPQFSMEHTLLIGDSLHADIKGGQIAGIDTCWFNPQKKPNDTEIVPTYEIDKLTKLIQIVGASNGRKS